MDTLFISDIHLSEDRPEKFVLFQNLLRGPARQAAALYILGDLYENFWLGNDDHTSTSQRVIPELAAFTRSGAKLFLIRGNRELMLDKGIETMTGCTLLPDMSVIELEGERVLIAHGDVLCTRDVKYQIYRRFMELGFIRKLFLDFPYPLRLLIARGLSPVIRKSSSKKPPGIIDVDQDAVIQTMREHGVLKLIHGHTHRPGIHEFKLGNQPARRIVLGDWYQQDTVLVCAGGEKKLMRVQEYLDTR
ncbi:MAG: UDP-2,3-diacylglucosamine diphosphatase [Gammaproteobacteria bacterium]